eukprot:gene3081-6040_t
MQVQGFKSSFGSIGKIFLTASKDNRLQLWDAETAQEKRSYVEKQHLSHSYLSYCWKQTGKDDLGFFAVGTSDGTIIVWDLGRGVVVKTLGQLNGQQPLSIAFSADASSIYVSSSNAQIVEYDIKSGEQISEKTIGKKGPLQLSMSPSENLLAISGSSVRILDLKSGHKRKLNSTFPGGVTAMSFSTCGTYLLCSGANTREILIFNIKDISADKSPIFTLSIDGISTFILAQTNILLGTLFIDIFTIFEDSTCCLYRCDISANTVEKCVIHSNSYTSILSAQFSSSSTITIASGQTIHPHFIRLDFQSTDGTFLEEMSIPSSSATALLSSSKSKATTSSREETSNISHVATVLGPHETGGSKRPVIDTLVSSSNKRVRSGSNGGDMTTITSTSSSDVFLDVNLTLEERLESLSATMLEAENIRVSSQTSNGFNNENPSSDSLVVLIDQALQSGDDSLLEQCLSCEDRDVVEATARRLPAGKVLLLLRRLVAKFEKRPSRGLLLTRWLAAMLRHHTSFLVSIPDLANQLAGLSQMLEQRLSSYTRLASLGGRLDLLMSQISNHSSSSTNSQSVKPSQIYLDE